MPEEMEELARSCGFDCTGFANVADLEINPGARDSCSDKNCNDFGCNWSCPPACGTLEEMTEKIHGYSKCLVVQSVAQMEDDFDIDCIVDTADMHRERMDEFVPKAREAYPEAFFISMDACKVCDECTYPDAPCTYPDRCFPTVEAAGLVAADVCTAAGIPYYHGVKSVTYIGCMFI